MGGPDVECSGAGACVRSPRPLPIRRETLAPTGQVPRASSGKREAVSCIHKGGIGSTMMP
jgi:hypothetical protein